MAVEFVRGDFQPFVVITKVHLGQIETDLEQGEVVLYDGTTMRRGSEDVNISSLRAAVKVGWLIPEANEGAHEARYVAKSAGVEIRAADSKSADRGPARHMGMVEDEERDMGGLQEVRPSNALRTHKAKFAGEVSEYDQGKPIKKKAQVIPEEDQEGRVIGAFKNSAKAKKIDISSTQASVLKGQLGPTGVQGVQVEKFSAASEHLEDIVPNSASTGVPDAGVAGEGAGEQSEARAKASALAEARRQERQAMAQKTLGEATVSASGEAIQNTEARVTVPKDMDTTVKISSGATAVGDASDGVVVGHIGTAPTKTPEAPMDEVIMDEVPSDAIVQAKIEMIQQFVPGFSWDMKDHWKARVKKALALKGNMPALNAVLSLETDTVRKHVMQAIYGN